MKTNSNLFEDSSSLDFSSEGTAQVTTLEDFLSDETLEKASKGKEEPVKFESQEEESTPTEDDLVPPVEKEVPDDESSGGEKPDDDNPDFSFEGGEKPIEDISQGIDYKGVLTKMIAEGTITGIDAIETDDGEIAFDELNVDEETFYNILNLKIAEDKESGLKNKISIDGVSDFTQKLIEIEKNGGNVTQAIESYGKYKEPLSELDMTNPEDMRTVLYMRYSAKGLESGEISRMVRGFEQDGILEERAISAYEEIDNAFKAHIESINQQAIEDRKRQKEALKTYRSSLGDALGKFEIKDTYKRKLLDSATREQKDGSFEVDRLYFEMRNNPETAAEVLMFLTDREEYIKQITKEVKRETNLETMKKLRLVNRNKTTVNLEEKPDKKEGYTDLSELLK